MNETEVTKSIEYSAIVDSLTEALSLVMAHTDEFTRPSISIYPIHVHGEEDMEEMFSVSIQGDV